MRDREGLLEAMRRDLRKVAPELVREGWTQEDVAEISATVRAHVAAGNDQGLEAMAKWLADRAWALLERQREAYARDRAKEVAVRHDEAALREMNRNWSRDEELKRSKG